MKLDTRWQLLLAIVGLGLVVALLLYRRQRPVPIGCEDAPPVTGATFVEGIVGAPMFLNPLLSDPYPVDQRVMDLIYDGLTAYDEQGQLVPALAESWELGEDGLEVTFRLRQDAVWHDGEAVAADDVVFTYGLLQAPDFPGDASLSELWQAVAISRVDGRTVRFRLPEPYSPFLAATTRGILPAHLLEARQDELFSSSAAVENPVGTGPFIAAPGQDWRASGRLRLTPNPTYWSDRPQIAGVEIRFFPDEESALAALAAGQIHALDGISPSNFPEAAALDSLRMTTSTAPRFTQLLFNLSESGAAALGNLAVRQALAYGLNRAALRQEVMNGQAVALEGPFPDTSWAYQPGLLTPYAHSPITATLRLDEAGWTADGEGAIRQQEDEALQLQLLVLDGQYRRRLASSIAEQWSEIGVGVRVEVVGEYDRFLERLRERAFDVALVEKAAADDPDLYDFWSQEAIVRGQNYGAWNNRQASEALERARQAWDTTERRRLYGTFLRLFAEDLPAITLFQHVRTYVVSDSAYAVDIGRLSRPRDRFSTFAEWFLQPAAAPTPCPDEVQS